ncbi:MFS transporter [Fusibacillus kribbianus]|uniref:MFS transporter n=1 Tax=Fusibacillus kribbianus TaxID=3044208 RepID=A0AAP4BBC1_9FIRM|nr:MFS transporter [Ruminococcus sp. YH-rum2234]MDI9241773.1 MFS transporter [Ruminococcus sp. YH-rum2234]
MNKELKTAATISAFTKWAVVAIISSGAYVVYLTYLARYSFYDQVIDGLKITNSQLGVLYGLYGTTATIAYFPGGVLADKVRVKYLATLGFAMSAILTFWYSTAPSYGQLKIIFLLFGLCTTFIFWGIRYKAIRLVSTEENYSTNIGISYGIVGVVGLVVSFISIAIFEAFADPTQGFKIVLMFFAIINAVFAVLSFICIPKFADEFAIERKKFNFSEVVQAFKHPGVWLTTLCMFFVYTVYTSLAYTVSFLTAIGATAAIASIVGTIRTYGTSLFSSPIIGGIAQKKTPSKTIIVCGIITAVSLAVMAVAPKSAGFIIPSVVLIIVLSFFLNGAYGVTSSMLTETNVPVAIFGSASGILSVIGFIPDMFVSPIAGKWLDTYDAAGAYTRIFAVLAVSAALAVLCALLVRVYKKKSMQKAN